VCREWIQCQTSSLPVNKPKSVQSSNVVPFITASGSGQSSFDTYDLSSDDEEYLTPKNEAQTTPRWSDRAAQLLTAVRLYSNLPPEAPKNWGQINPNLNDYHSDPIEISSIFWRPDITDWWRQPVDTQSKYTDPSNVVRDTLSIIPHRVRVEASISLGGDLIGWRQSITTGETLRKKVVVRQFAGGNTWILAGGDPASDTTNTENNLGIKKKAVLLYDLRGSRSYPEITELTHRLQSHSRRLIHESLLSTATGFRNHELAWSSMKFQTLMYLKTELLLQ